jgi:hypothetical protein
MWAFGSYGGYKKWKQLSSLKETYFADLDIDGSIILNRS